MEETPQVKPTGRFAALRRAGPGLACSALSGFLLFLSFPPPDLGPLAFVALAPLFFAVARSASYARAALYGAVAGVVACLPAFAWVASVTVGGWVVLALYVALYSVAGAVGVRYAQRNAPLWWPVAAALLWTALEFARARLGPGFPWLFVGYTQYRFDSLLQAAAVGGVYAVSFVVVLVNAGLASAADGLMRWRANDGARPLRRGAVVLALSLLVLGGACVAGAAAARNLRIRRGPVVGVVQQNIPRRVEEIVTASATDRELGERMEAEVRKAAELSRRLEGSGTRLVVWPETTVGVALNVRPALFNVSVYRDVAAFTTVTLRELGHKLDAYLLVGAPSYVTSAGEYIREPVYGPDVTGFANSAVLFSPQGEFLRRYDKIRLVPFGEYIPLRDLLPFLQKLTPLGRQLTAGREGVVFQLPPRGEGEPLGAAALICYEDVFPDLVRSFRRAGADFMVNLTDEGWYDIPGELRQHLAMAVFRAVETRTTVVRAANTGISCFIGPTGRIYARLQPLTEGFLSAPLRLSDERTPYVRWGDAFALACAVLTVALPLGAFIRRRTAGAAKSREEGA
ncbi:MAG: apolipoprotein N-acyltransferase [Planctomycetota bacterium]